MTVPSYYSARHDADVYFGKLPAKPIENAIPFDQVRAIFLKAGGTLPTMPTDWLGFATDFKEAATIRHGGWGVLGNAQCDDNTIPVSWAARKGSGCCVWSGAGHEEMEDTKSANALVPPFTCLNIVEQYAAYSGYSPQTGANDNGSNVADVVQWRQTKGLLDTNGVAHKIGKAIELKAGDAQQLFEGVYLLEQVGVGCNLTEANMRQYNNGGAWEYVPGSKTIGGHYVPGMGRVRTSPNQLVTISWGMPQNMTKSFIQHQVDEMVGWISLARYNAKTGLDAEDHTQVDEERYIAALAAEQKAEG